ncbi:MAG: TIGR03757 family integrating conjugative element protein [Nitrospiraceae bacterium]
MAADIRIFTDRRHPIEAPAGIRIVALDAPALIEAELAADLPTDPTQAAELVQQRLKVGGADLQRRMAEAYQGVTDAWSLGITKVPAIMVDRRYVIYGESDMARALARIEAYRSAHQ